MNEEKPTRRAFRLLPYMLLAVAAALAAARCTAQLGWSADSVDARLAAALAFRDAGFVSGQWVPSRAYAPLLLPLHALYVAATGGADGLACFLALVGVAFSLAVALFAYETLRTGFGRFPAACAALACLFFGAALDAGEASAARLCALFFLLALLFAWRLYCHARAVPDDGAPDARRVLLPFAAGLAAGLACASNPHVPAVLAIALVLFLLFARLRRAPFLAVFVLWGLAGCLVVGIGYLWFLVVWFSGSCDVMALVPQAFGAWICGLVPVQTLPAYLHQLVIDRLAFIGTWILVVVLVVWRWSGRDVSATGRIVVLAVDFALFLMACINGFSSGMHPAFPLLAFVEFALPCYFLFDDMHLARHPEILSLWVPGILLSLVCHFLDGGQGCALYAGFLVVCTGAFATVRDVCVVKERSGAQGETGAKRVFAGHALAAGRVLHAVGCACIASALCATAASCLLAPDADADAGPAAQAIVDNAALSGLSGATFKSETIPVISQG